MGRSNGDEIQLRDAVLLAIKPKPPGYDCCALDKSGQVVWRSMVTDILQGVPGLPGCVRVCRGMPGCVQVCWGMPGCVGVYQVMSGCARVCQDVSGCIRLCQGVPGCPRAEWVVMDSHGLETVWPVLLSRWGHQRQQRPLVRCRDFHSVSMECGQDSISASSQATSYGSFAAYFLHTRSCGSVAEQLAPLGTFGSCLTWSKKML